MQKQITSILLVAGTCIGAGMIALPMALAKLGVIPSIAIMLATWFLTYYSSLVSVELNLQSDRGLSLGLLGRKFSGKITETVGEVSVKLLSYALLSAYIYGGSSIIQKLIEEYIHIEASIISIEITLAGLAIIALLFPTKIVSKINNTAFAGFSLLFLILIGAIISEVDYSNVPWIVYPDSSNILSVVTIVFTSFGYQVIFHTLRDYLGRNTKALTQAFLYGSIIPMIAYMLWTCSSLSVIFKSAPKFFMEMIDGKVDVGDLVMKLANISGLPDLQILIWWLSILAIVTSIIGVGLGLTESFNLNLKNRIKNSKLASAIITIVPAYIVAAIVPNAFIKVLGVAGAILVVIAILLPVYLFFKAKFDKVYIKILKKWGLIICCLIGIGIMMVEFNHNCG